MLRSVLLLSTCIAAALAHGTSALQGGGAGGGGAEAVRAEPTFGAGAGVRIGGTGGFRGSRGRWGRGYGLGGWRSRYGGWIYPAIDEVVVAPGAYGYGMGGYGAGGYTVVQQPPVVVAQQPASVVYAQQPSSVVLAGGGGGIAAAPPATTTVYAPAEQTTATAETTTATTAAAGPAVVASPPATTVVAQTPPTVIAAPAAAPATGFVAAAAPTQVLSTASIVPELTYASPYYFGAGSNIVYPGYVGGPRGWYGRFRGRYGLGRFGRRFGYGGYLGYPYGNYGGGILGTGIVGGDIGVALPPIYVGGRYRGPRYGRRRLSGDTAQPLMEGDSVVSQPLEGQARAAPGTDAAAESLPTKIIKTDNPSEKIMTLGGDRAPLAGDDTTAEQQPSGSAQPLISAGTVSSAQPMGITAALDPSKIQSVDVTATVMPRA